MKTKSDEMVKTYYKYFRDKYNISGKQCKYWKAMSEHIVEYYRTKENNHEWLQLQM